MQNTNLLPLQPRRHRRLALQPQLPHLTPDAGPQHGMLSPEGTSSCLCQRTRHYILCIHCRTLLKEPLARKEEPKRLQIPVLQHRHGGILGLEGPGKPARSHQPPPAALVGQQRSSLCSAVSKKSPSSHFWLSTRLGIWTFAAFWVLLPPTTGYCKTSQGVSVWTRGQGVRYGQARVELQMAESSSVLPHGSVSHSQSVGCTEGTGPGIRGERL